MPHRFEIKSGSRRSRLVLAACAMLWAGCGVQDVPESAVSPAVRQASLSIPGSVAPPNPTTGQSTPDSFSRALAQVYQREDVSDRAVDKVLLLMPGFLGGAGNFDYIARRLVERSAGRTAVWAIDRRSNGMEDQTGMDAAEAQRNPDLAKLYYFGGASVNGRTFAGLLRGPDTLFASEWGIRTHVEDLDALVTAALARYPAASVFLGGHSLGASIVPIYAAWDFGRYAGFSRLSGLILLEGAPNPSGTAPSQTVYETSGISAGFGRTSLKTVRANPLTSLEPLVSSDLFLTAEILAMRSHSSFGQPDALSPDSDLYRDFFGLLFGLSMPPRATNRAALGMGFDNDFEPLSFARISLGSATGGSIAENPNSGLFGGFVGPGEKLLAPTDPEATYSWSDSASDLPDRNDPTRIDTFAAMLYRGPSNFIEWYFPARLTLDVSAVGNLNVKSSGDWRKDLYGMAVTENARMDLPVFAVGGSRGLLPNLSRLDPYKASIAPYLRDGTAREAASAGFRTMLMDRYVHLDVLSAWDEEGEGNGLFGALTEWMGEAARRAPRPSL